MNLGVSCSPKSFKSNFREFKVKGCSLSTGRFFSLRPCRFIAPILAEMAKMPHIMFLKVVEELESVAKEWDIEAIPTLIFIKEGKLVDKIVGAQKEALQIAVTKHDTPVAVTATA